MPFQKGNQAAARRGTPFADMLRIALKEAGKAEGTTRLRDVADMLVKEAIKGNIQAAKEIADRMDGKAPQPVEADVTGALKIELVHFADNPDPE